MENLGFVHDSGAQNDYKSIKCDKQSSCKTYTFEEAVQLTGHGRFHLFLLLIGGLCLMAVMVEIMIVGMIIPIAKCDLNFSLYEQGILGSAGFMGVVISSHTWGFLADTWGRLKVLRIAITCSLIFSLISAFSINVWMLIILRFMVGLLMSGCQACVFSYVGEFHGNKTRTQAVTFLSTFLPLGLVFLPGIATIIIPMDINAYIFDMKFSTWRLFIILNLLPSIVAFIALPFIPESPKYLLIQGKHDMAIEVLQTSFSWNKNKPKYEYPVKKIHLDTVGANIKNIKSISDGLRTVWTQTIPLFYKIRILNSLNLIFHMFIIYFVAHGTFVWFPNILATMVSHMNEQMTVCKAVQLEFWRFNTNNGTDLNSTDCSDNVDVIMYEILIIMGIAYTLIYILFGIFIDRIGKKRLLIIWMIVAAICGISLVWTEGFYLNVFLMTVFLAVGNCGGIISTISLEYYPTNINAMALCLVMMTGRIGSVIGSNLIGTIISYNCNILFYAFSGIILFTSLLSIFIKTKPAESKVTKPIV